MLLNIEYFPENLSILESNVDQFSTIVYDLCNQRAEITKNYHTHHKSKEEISHFEVFGREDDSDNLYLKVGRLKRNTENQFEKFGVFITEIIEETPKIKDRFEHIFLTKTKLIEKVFEDITVNTCKLVKALTLCS